MTSDVQFRILSLVDHKPSPQSASIPLAPTMAVNFTIVVLTTLRFTLLYCGDLLDARLQHVIVNILKRTRSSFVRNVFDV